jgi:hypothetical protein
MANSRLSRTISSGSTTNKFTLSFWIKKSAAHTNDEWLFENYNSGSARTWVRFNLDTGNPRLEVSEYTGSYIFRKITNRIFRDTSAWYHIHIQFDSTQATDTDRLKIYINGVQETSFAQTNHPAQNATSIIANTGTQYIGYSQNIGGAYFSGYMSHNAFVQGSALAPTTFGQTDSTSGIWKFKSPAGVTWGTHGFHLKFENSAALGTDSSGNTNTFTVNGNLKQALDTPSNVYATMNPLNVPTSNAPTFSFGNTKTVTAGSSGRFGGTSTLGMSAGKFYVEAKATVAANPRNCIGTTYEPSEQARNNGTQYSYSDSISYNAETGDVVNSSGTIYSGSTYTTGDIIQMAIDMDNNKLYFGKNGTWLNSGVPTSGSTGTGAVSLTANKTQFIIQSDNTSGSDQSTFEFNFGNGFFGITPISSAGSNGNGSLFEYDVPSGYYALNTKNLNTYG